MKNDATSFMESPSANFADDLDELTLPADPTERTEEPQQARQAQREEALAQIEASRARREAIEAGNDLRAERLKANEEAHRQFRATGKQKH